MPIATDTGHRQPAAPHDSPAGERFILLRDVLELRRKNRPPRLPPSASEPEGLDWCRLIRGQDIEPFQLRGPEQWADYHAIAAGFERPRRKSGSIPYSYEEVFAPVKVVLRDQGEPLKAALTYLPVYPLRGKLGIPQPGASLALVYAAVGLLNSYLGLAYYRENLRRVGKPGSASTTHVDALRLLPVARVDHSPAALRLAAQLTYQVITLYEAQRDCDQDLWHHIQPLRQRLAWALATLLGLSETEEEALKRSVQDVDLPDAGQPRLIAWHTGLPPLPPVELCSHDDALLCGELLQKEEQGVATASDIAAIERLQSLLHWQDLVNAPFPERLQLAGMRPG